LKLLLSENAYSWAHAASIARDIRAGRFAEPELAIVPHAARAGETVLDLGANLGMYLPALSTVVGETGTVYAFEPIPYTFRTLTHVKTLLRLRNVMLVPKGCADTDARVTFEVPVQGSGAAATGQAYLGRRNDGRAGWERQVRWTRTEPVEADVVKLDSFLSDASDISLIKADIEGAELLAFHGAVKLIERWLPTVICEINPWFLDGFGLGLHDLLGFFSDRQYVLYKLDDGDRRLRTVAEAAGLEEDNYVFVHPKRLARLDVILASSR
jgi:FkbM family methyltransferase